MDIDMLVGDSLERGTETPEQVLNPRNGSLIEGVPEASEAQVDKAVVAARESVQDVVADDAGTAFQLSAAHRGGDRGGCARVRGA